MKNNKSGKGLKCCINGDEHLTSAVGFFVLGALLIAGGAITGLAFLGLIGGGCFVLGLERLVRRSAAKAGGTMSDLKADEEKNRNRKKTIT